MKTLIVICLVVGIMWGLAPVSFGLTTTGWTEYASNPVYNPGKAYYPSIVLDGSTYKMWSTGSTGIQYSTSTNGTSWTTINSAVSGLASAHHVQVKKYPSFAGSNSGSSPSSDTMNYRIWYWDMGANLYSINAIRYAESADGQTWYNDQAVTQVGATVVATQAGGVVWNSGSYGPADILYNPGGSETIVTPVNEASVWANKFVMYYDGTTGGDEFLGLAVSNNGINWHGYNGGAAPVLDSSASGWDSGYVGFGTVIKESDDVFHLWFSGGSGYKLDHGIGYASSTDGINWVKDIGNPIFHKDDGVAWRDERTYTPVVIGDQMWFTGKDVESGTYAIGYAVPEPATLVLLGLGGLLVRKVKRA